MFKLRLLAFFPLPVKAISPYKGLIIAIQHFELIHKTLIGSYFVFSLPLRAFSVTRKCNKTL